MLRLEQKTKLSAADGEDFLKRLFAVDFNNRNEESLYKWEHGKKHKGIFYALGKADYKYS